MTLRVASLDYLGTVAARLRRDAVCTQQREIDDILEAVCWSMFSLALGRLLLYVDDWVIKFEFFL